MATADCEEDEWELLNIDGFVYKRKKRPNPTTTTTSSAPPPDLAAAEEKNRREMKKRALAKLRDKYQKEIDQWELLSNMLWAFQLKTQNSQQLQEQTTSYDLTASSPPPPEHSSESASRRLLDDLLLRAEAEEGIIQDLSNLCHMAEVVCNVQEDHAKQSLVDLPIWASPRELLASLCDE
ncbi:uncharacterized protein LOC114303580 [Camellia sinensis]|uniref:uncharacterized protein LOC114303580 n=1 Tax=Camellia sinensis TaxID=4442 RepID=UPI001035952E|nr:uncharacterized protein LOC114303580 [Camellia sinensis]